MKNTLIMGGAAGAVLPVVVLTALLAGSGGALATKGTACTILLPAAGARAGGGLPTQLPREQLTNATTILAAARNLGLPVRAAAIGLMTAQQESGLLNLDHGDRDSLGLFQQRPSQGWGTAAELLDPTYAATSFYTRLATIPGWASIPMATAAQLVQHSEDGSRYLRWADFGTAIADSLWDGNQGQLLCTQQRPAALPAGSGPVTGAVVAFAEAQLGKPYVYGASGPDAFDCSGLVLRAYQSGGIGLPRTSQEQWSAGPRVAQDQLAPGDLVFFDPDPFGRPGHVGIYAGNGTMIDAPNSNGVVRVEMIEGFGPYMGAVRPTDGHTTTSV